MDVRVSFSKLGKTKHNAELICCQKPERTAILNTQRASGDKDEAWLGDNDKGPETTQEVASNDMDLADKENFENHQQYLLALLRRHSCSAKIF